MAFSAFIVFLCAFALFEHTTAFSQTEKSQESLEDAVQARAVKVMLEKMMKRGGVELGMEKELQEIYHVMDTNGDGGVTIQEYTVYYGTTGGKPSDAQTSFTAIDNNKNGNIEYLEFRDFTLKNTEQHHREHEKQIPLMFNKIDKNGDGFITAEEWYKDTSEHGMAIPMDRIHEMIGLGDIDLDGKLSLPEYTAMQSH